MRFFFLFLFLFFLSPLFFLAYGLPVNTQNQDPFLKPPPTLNGTASISYLWETGGAEIYTLWGHCALRVTDPSLGYDVVFNFGTFDSEVPNFVFKFMQGSMLYTQSNYPFQDYLFEKSSQQNIVYELALNISPSEKQAVLNELYRRYKPENRYYHYDYFYENCSTKIRDVLKTTLGKDVSFSSATFPFSSTFRDHIDPYLSPWIRFGISILLGMPTDKKISPNEEAFLPEYLASELKAQVKTDGKPLVLMQRIIHNNPATNRHSPFSPTLVFWLLFIAIVLLSIFTEFGRYADFLLFPICGLIGCLLVFLWFGSNYYGNKTNLNLAWAFPLHLLFPFLRGQTRRVYALIFWLLGILLLSGWILIPQRFDPATIPIVLIITSRMLFALDIKNAIKTALQRYRALPPKVPRGT